MGDQENPLLVNLDRAVFTFNMHNLAEQCFNHVLKKQNNEMQITADQQILVDQCIFKYM